MHIYMYRNVCILFIFLQTHIYIYIYVCACVCVRVNVYRERNDWLTDTLCADLWPIIRGNKYWLHKNKSPTKMIKPKRMNK